MVEGPGAPRVAEEDGCLVVLDGALREREGLEAVATGPGAHEDDATLVLRAYRRMGRGFLDHLRGSFALVVCDDRQGSILAIRDPLGAYPLFHARAAGRLLLSTSSDALLEAPGVSRAVNRPALAALLCHEWPEREETYLAAVRRVPTGHVLECRGADERLSRYWDPAPPGEPMRWVGDDELDRFDDLLARAADRGVVLGAPAIFLSGGLDSVSVAAVAADRVRARGGPPLLALSVRFPDSAGNEESVQRGVAAALGIPHVVTPFDDLIGGRGMLIATMEMSARWPWPLQNPWNPAYSELAALGASQGRRVLLGGDGGDEWMAVSPFYIADLLRTGDLPGLARFARMTVRSYRMTPRTTLQLFWMYGLRALLSEKAGRLLRRAAPEVLRARRRRRLHRETPSWVGPEPAVRRELATRRERIIATERGDPPGMPRYLRSMRQLLTSVSRSMEREESFETGRRLGMHVVDPYWDDELVDFLYRMPPERLFWGGRSKGPARRLAANRLPGLGFGQQRKVTLSTYYRDRLLLEVEGAWKHLGGISALASLGLVDATGASESAGRVLAEQDAREVSRLAGLMNVEAWLRPRL